MKTILAIINEPNESKDFIHYLAELASDLKSNVHLLYVQYPGNYAMGTAGSMGTAVAQLQKNLENFEKEAKKILDEDIKDIKGKLNTDIDIDYSTQVGVASEIASELVSSGKADMLALKGKEKESFLFQTSINMDIIKEVDCPVWIIPDKAKYQPFKEIIYASDYKEEDIAGIKRLVALTEQFSPFITALHVTENRDFEEKVKHAGFVGTLQEKTDYKRLSVKALVEGDDSHMPGLINDYAMLIEADLVVVMKEDKSFFERIFESDHTKKILSKSTLPVLVFHEESE